MDRYRRYRQVGSYPPADTGHITTTIHRLQDPSSNRATDPRLIVEHAGNRRDRDFGVFGDFSNRGQREILEKASRKM